MVRERLVISPFMAQKNDPAEGAFSWYTDSQVAGREFEKSSRRIRARRGVWINESETGQTAPAGRVMKEFGSFDKLSRCMGAPFNPYQ